MLTGKTGEALWESRQEADGSTPLKDMVGMQWRRAGVSILHKAFRSISATALKGHATHARFVEHFLGHAPRGMAERHYAGEDAAWQTGFDEAVAWLRTAVLG